MDYYLLEKEGENSKCAMLDLGKCMDSDENSTLENASASSESREPLSAFTGNGKCEENDNRQENVYSRNDANNIGKTGQVFQTSDDQVMEFITADSDIGEKKSTHVEKDSSIIYSPSNRSFKDIIDMNAEDSLGETKESLVSQSDVNVDEEEEEEKSDLMETPPEPDQTTSSTTTDVESTKSNVSHEVASSTQVTKSLDDILDNFCDENSDKVTSQGSSYSDTSNNTEDKDLLPVDSQTTYHKETIKGIDEITPHEETDANGGQNIDTDLGEQSKEREEVNVLSEDEMKGDSPKEMQETEEEHGPKNKDGELVEGEVEETQEMIEDTIQEEEKEDLNEDDDILLPQDMPEEEIVQEECMVEDDYEMPQETKEDEVVQETEENTGDYSKEPLEVEEEVVVQEDIDECVPKEPQETVEEMIQDDEMDEHAHKEPQEIEDEEDVIDECVPKEPQETVEMVQDDEMDEHAHKEPQEIEDEDYSLEPQDTEEEEVQEDDVMDEDYHKEPQNNEKDENIQEQFIDEKAVQEAEEEYTTDNDGKGMKEIDDEFEQRGMEGKDQDPRDYSDEGSGQGDKDMELTETTHDGKMGGPIVQPTEDTDVIPEVAKEPGVEKLNEEPPKKKEDISDDESEEREADPLKTDRHEDICEDNKEEEVIEGEHIVGEESTLEDKHADVGMSDVSYSKKRHLEDVEVTNSKKPKTMSDNELEGNENETKEKVQKKKMIKLVRHRQACNQEKIMESSVENEKIGESNVENEKIVESNVENEKIVESNVENEKIVESNAENEKIVESNVENEKIVESNAENEKTVESNVENEKIVESNVENGVKHIEGTVIGDNSDDLSVSNLVDHQKEMDHSGKEESSADAETSTAKAEVIRSEGEPKGKLNSEETDRDVEMTETQVEDKELEMSDGVEKMEESEMSEGVEKMREPETSEGVEEMEEDCSNAEEDIFEGMLKDNQEEEKDVSKPQIEVKAKKAEASKFPNKNKSSSAKSIDVPEDNEGNVEDSYIDFDEESIENISRTIRSFSNEKSVSKGLEKQSSNSGKEDYLSPSKKVITAPNVEKVKQKLEEMLAKSKGEEDSAIAELQRMKEEKTDILNAITIEMEKLKSMLVKEKQG